MRRLLFSLLFLLLVNIPFTRAVSVTSIALETLGCSLTPEIRVTVTGSHIEPPAADDVANVDIYDGDGAHVASYAVAWSVGYSNFPIAQTIRWTTPPQANPLRVVVVDSSSGVIAAEQEFSTECIARTNEQAAAAYATTGTQLTVIQEADEQYGFTITGIALDGQTGVEVVTFSADELAALPKSPDENLLIAKSSAATYWGNVNVYLLTTGEIQVNVGPDAEGKVRVTIYDAIPPTRVYGYEFSIYDVEAMSEAVP